MAGALAIDAERDEVARVRPSAARTVGSEDGPRERLSETSDAPEVSQLELALKPPPTKRLNEALAELGPLKPGTVIRLADLPPPPRPSRAASEFVDAAEVRRSAIPDLGDARLAADDVAGGELVRALASLPVSAGPAMATVDPRPASAVAESLAEAMEAPPMIIERARAEQTLARLTGPLEIARLSPMPGLSAGFALSLAAGLVLYLLMG